MRAVRLHEAASQEAIEAAAWYEHKRPGLGAKFDQTVQVAFDLLQQEIIPAALRQVRPENAVQNV